MFPFSCTISKGSVKPVVCWILTVVGCATYLLFPLPATHVAPTQPSPLRPINSSGATSECQSLYYDTSNLMNPFFFIKHLPTLPEEIRNRQPVLPRRTRSTPEYTLVLDLVSVCGRAWSIDVSTRPCHSIHACNV